eukprot:GDKI01049728.1.p1 GENE.GDKI01049728.1~~GDKI01049728.1.p1  ORF type:complete len:698 (+),score=293.01 GDKI01049728.1:120-2213(+)
MNKERDLGKKVDKGGEDDISAGPFPYEKRKCTDILCFLLFVAHWAAAIAIAISAFTLGNPKRLVVGQDFNNQFCSIDTGSNTTGTIIPSVENFGKLAYLPDVGYINEHFKDMMDDLSKGVFNTSKLLDNSGAAVQVDFTQMFKPVCVKTCPCYDKTGWSYTCSAEKTTSSELTRKYESNGLTFPALSLDNCPYEERYCVPIKTPDFTLLDTYCFPRLSDGDGNELKMEDLLPGSVTGTWEQWVGDLVITWPMIILSMGVALVVGIIFLVILRFAAGFLVWVSIITALAAFYVGGGAAYLYNDQFEGKTNQDAILVFGYALWAIGAIFTLMVFCLRNQIRLGVAIVKTAAQFTYSVPSVLWMPVINWLAALILYFWWVLVAVYIMSSVSEEEVAAGKRYSWNRNTQYTFAYHFFHLLWNNAFFIAMNQMILAGAVAAWYFSPIEADGKRNVGSPLCKSFRIAVMKHMGTAAFGSLILAIVQFVKWWLRYLQYQAQQVKDNQEKACEKCSPCGIGKVCAKLNIANKTFVCLIGCLGYLVACFEKCVEFLNKNAYIQTAITGKSFCAAAWAAFTLILRNLARFGVAATMGKAIKFLGLVAIAGIAALVGFLCTNAAYKDKISSPWIPTIVFILVGWLVGSLIMDVYGMAVDTTLCCFLADVEMHGGEGQFTPAPLKEFLPKVRSKGGCCGGKNSQPATKE